MDPLLQDDHNPLQAHYQRFQVDRRILLSGHSHQAWPDLAREAQIQAFDDAARLVDDKWEAAFERADQLRDDLGNLMNVPAERIVLGASTHDLLIRFLSCLPWRQNARIVTTDGEFHSMRRQLERLEELGVRICRVPVNPISNLADRMIAQLDPSTIAVMASLVMFQDGQIFRNAGKLVQQARQRSIAPLIDLYHVLNVMPLDVRKWDLEPAFLTGGGYKYLQWGEGNCFLSLPQSEPAGWTERPAVTGWFAEFAALENPAGGVPYGPNHHAFAGATYDPVSHYRAVAVSHFFKQQQLTPERLRQINLQQQLWLTEGLANLNLPASLLSIPETPAEQRGGFLPLLSDCAPQWVKALRQHQVYCDCRNGILRLGPAPYVSRRQIFQAVEIMGQIAKSL